MSRIERIGQIIATFVCLTLVFTLRDVGPRQAPPARNVLPPVPDSITHRPGKVLIKVETAAGTPVAAASVRVLSIQSDQAYLAGAARTDASGTASIGALPTGETWVLAEKDGLARASTRVVLDVAAREIFLRLVPAETLRVAVSDDAEVPIADASVEVATGDPLLFSERTDAAGQAVFSRLGSPPWNIQVRAAGFEATNQSVGKVTAEPAKVTLRRLGFIDVAAVDVEGKPIPGATVLVAGSNLWPSRRTRTDARGGVKVSDLPRGVYDFRALHGDLVSPTEVGIMLESGQSKSVTLSLSPGRRVAVRVTDGEADGARAVPSANVVLAEGGLSSFPMEATTDARGTANLGPIAPGDAFVSVQADGFVPRTGVAVPQGPSPSVHIGLVRGAALIGEVVDGRGYPVDGASIEVIGTTPSGEPIDESPERSAFRVAHFSWALGGARELVSSGELGVMRGPVPGIPRLGSAPSPVRAATIHEPWVTRDDGTFRAFPIPAGRVRAIVRHPSYLEGVSEIVALTPAGEAKVKVVLGGGGTLEGRVLDDRHLPLPSVRVDVAAAKGSLQRTTFTAKDGTFAFAALPGEIVISVGRPDAIDDVALRTNVTVGEGERREIELVLPAMRERVAVEIVDDRGARLSGAQVLFVSLSPDAPLKRTLFTDGEGRAVFKDALGLPARISVSHRGLAPQTRELEAAPAEMRIALEGGIRVTGTVTTRRGRDPLEGADVTLHAATGPLRARTDRDGAYHLDDVPPGPTRLSVARSGYAKVEQSVWVEPSTRPDRSMLLERIDLSEGGIIEGEVVDARGDSVTGARVAQGTSPIYLPSGRLPPGVVLTNRRGEFKLEDVPEGDVAVEAYAAGSGRGRVTGVRVAAGRITDRVRITLGGADSEAGLDAAEGGGVAVSFDEKGQGGSGVRVVTVGSGSEAERAGIEPGDRIVAVDGQRVSSAKDARARLSGPPGDDVVIELSRGVDKRKLRLTRERVHR